MRLSRTICGLIAAVWAAVIAAVAHAAPPVEAYGSLPEVADATLSPNGKRAALLINGSDGSRGLLIRDLTTGENKAISAGKLKVRDVFWANDTYVVVIASGTADIQFAPKEFSFEAFGAISVNADTMKDARLLAGSSQVGLNINTASVVGVDRAGDAVYMPAFSSSGSSAFINDDSEWTLYRVDLKTGNGVPVQKFGDQADSLIMNAEGALVARARYDSARRVFEVFAHDGAASREIFSQTRDLPDMSALGLDATGTRLVVAQRPSGSDLVQLFEMSLADGSLTGPIAQDGRFDVSGMISDPFTGRYIGYGVQRDSYEQQFSDSELRGLLSSLKEAFGGQRVVLSSWSKDRRRVIVRAEGDGNPGAYFLFDRDSGRADQLAEAYPKVPAEQVAEVRVIEVTARDGMKIPAYLTLPPGKAAQNLPLVALPHGGPEARDSISFDFMAQFLASRGYAVVQPQFRGSDGFGNAFREAGRGKWGREMQWDVSDAVKHVVGQGIADAGRVCIFGWSYGGYSALAGAAFTPGEYRCVVAGAPVSDLPEMIRWELKRSGPSAWVNRYWARVIGDKTNLLKEISPAMSAAAVQAPVLLIHGDDDTVVPIEQSEIMERALKRAGKPVEFVKLKGDDHWLSTGPTRTEMLRQLEAFLAKHNPA